MNGTILDAEPYDERIQSTSMLADEWIRHCKE